MINESTLVETSQPPQSLEVLTYCVKRIRLPKNNVNKLLSLLEQKFPQNDVTYKLFGCDVATLEIGFENEGEIDPLLSAVMGYAYQENLDYCPE